MSNLFAILLMMMMMANYGDNQDVAIERSLYIIWWKRTSISHKWRDLFETGLNYICSLNEIPVSSLLVSLNVHCYLSHLLAEESQGTVSSARIYSTLYVDKDRGVPGDGQHYMLSTLYVERGVPRDGQRDYMLTLYSQHYMLTLFLQKIARHYLLII